jgi:hypothetical protein
MDDTYYVIISSKQTRKIIRKMMATRRNIGTAIIMLTLGTLILSAGLQKQIDELNEKLDKKNKKETAE